MSNAGANIVADTVIINVDGDRVPNLSTSQNRAGIRSSASSYSSRPASRLLAIENGSTAGYSTARSTAPLGSKENPYEIAPSWANGSRAGSVVASTVSPGSSISCRDYGSPRSTTSYRAPTESGSRYLAYTPSRAGSTAGSTRTARTVKTSAARSTAGRSTYSGASSKTRRSYTPSSIARSLFGSSARSTANGDSDVRSTTSRTSRVSRNSRASRASRATRATRRDSTALAPLYTVSEADSDSEPEEVLRTGRELSSARERLYCLYQDNERIVEYNEIVR